MDDLLLIKKAEEAMENSYAKYSNFRVGAALLTKSGKVFTGCNVENASYGATICAERVAAVKAVSEGEQEFLSIAIVSSGKIFTYPCGVCRQFLSEFGDDMSVILKEKDEIKKYLLKELLPFSFKL